MRREAETCSSLCCMCIRYRSEVTQPFYSTIYGPRKLEGRFLYFRSFFPFCNISLNSENKKKINSSPWAGGWWSLTYQRETNRSYGPRVELSAPASGTYLSVHKPNFSPFLQDDIIFSLPSACQVYFSCTLLGFILASFFHLFYYFSFSLLFIFCLFFRFLFRNLNIWLFP
jgi:hypothetical protein